MIIDFHVEPYQIKQLTEYMVEIRGGGEFSRDANRQGKLYCWCKGGDFPGF